MNTNISSLRTIVEAMQAGDYIVSCTPLVEDGKQTGYTITFAKSGSIVIYHGSDGTAGNDGANGSDGANGKDGKTPQIGVKKDADGVLYWTVDGEWLKDDAGNKIPVSGKDGVNGADGADGQPGNDGAAGADGNDGITPEFKIEDGYWYISYDNGTTWKQLGKATGADGADGQDGENSECLFKDINTSDPNYVTLTLSDGSKIKLPRDTALTISFGNSGKLQAEPNKTYNLNYTIDGNTENLQVDVLFSGNVRAKVADTTAAIGILTIYTSATIDEFDKVIMIASNGRSTVMSSISFEEKGALNVTGDTSYEVPAAGGSIDINIETNTDYTVSIPEAAAGWVSVDGSRAMRQETITLTVEANTGDARSASVWLTGKDGTALAEIELSQKAMEVEHLTIPSDMTLAFPDPNFREYVLANFDRNKDGVISQEEAEKVKHVHVGNSQFAKDIATIDGIEYFSNLESLYCAEKSLTHLDASRNYKLESLICSKNQLVEVELTGCYALKELNCSVNNLSNLDISLCNNLEKLSCYNNSLKELDASGRKHLKDIDCGNNPLTQLNVDGCSALVHLTCNTTDLKTLDISKTALNTSTEYLPLRALDNPKLETLYIKKGWSIHGVTEDRQTMALPDETQIIFVD